MRATIRTARSLRWHPVLVAFRRRVLPVVVAAAAVVAAAVYFHETGQTYREDKWLALALVNGWVLLTMQMLVGTPRWSLRSIALLVTSVGLIFFFGRFMVGLWGWWYPGPWVDATYRGCFAVSTPLVIVESLRYFWAVRPRRGDRLWRWRAPVLAEAPPADVLLAALADAMPLVVADDAGTIHRTTRSLDEVVGARPGALIGQNLVVLMPARYRQAHRAGLARFLATGETSIIGKTVPVQLLRTDGEEVDILLGISTAVVDRARWFIGAVIVPAEVAPIAPGEEQRDGG